MNHLKSLFLALAAFCLAACSDDMPTVGLSTAESFTYPSSFQMKVNDKPYPQESDKVFISPAPLIVPASMKTSDSLQFQLSQDSLFLDGSTMLSKPSAWCMFNPYRILAYGKWYWRFRNKSSKGDFSAWSTTYKFDVTHEASEFVTPAFSVFLKNAPTTHPRLYCFLDKKLDAARKTITKHAEYKAMISLANKASAIDYNSWKSPWDSASSTLRYNVQYLHTAYCLTQDRTYANEMLAILRKLLSSSLSSSTLFASNFGSTDIALCLTPIYDEIYYELTASERQNVESILWRILSYYYPRQITYEENHIFDNHFWQQNMRVLLQCAFLLYDKPAYKSKVEPMLEYYYEIWTAKAPNSGQNRDGEWSNGTCYFLNNVETLYYVPELFSYITGSDFLAHPWYHNAGKAIVYTWPPDSKSLGFGDGWEKYTSPQRQRVAFTDFLARELGDSYAGWYASQQIKTLRNDPDLRLYRICNVDKTYGTSLPSYLPKMVCYEDVGEVIMHSDLGDTSDDCALSFRSSVFGSGSHTLADQNGFNVLYKGDYVYCSTGYYQSFNDKHNLLSYRHSRAHNTILVNGIGQSFSTESYGDIVRAMGGDHISYCLGDASHAYCGISNDNLWVQAFTNAGIAQTAEYGFGKTPLTKYRRHVLMLQPNIIVIYDELEASEAVRWDWLLHSPTQFTIDEKDDKLTTHNTTKGFWARTQLFSNETFEISQTDKFFANPASGITARYPNQWHLTASIANSKATRILAVIQVVDNASELQTINRSGNTITIGNWVIDSQLSASDNACLHISNTLSPVTFSYTYPGASILYDSVNGNYSTFWQYDGTSITNGNAAEAHAKRLK